MVKVTSMGALLEATSQITFKKITFQVHSWLYITSVHGGSEAAHGFERCLHCTLALSETTESTSRHHIMCPLSQVKLRRS